MTPEDGSTTPRWRIRLAYVIALAADLVQAGMFPVFSEGALSPFDDALDVGVGIALTVLLGWNWAFLPSFAIELIPGADLAPTWTLAVWVASRGARKPSAAVLDAEPVPAQLPAGDREKA
jgi:hypothetical protein